MSDSTPTERFDAPPAQQPASAQQSRRLIYILIGVGAALLVGIIILVVVLLTRGDGTPTAAPAPSVTPTVIETPSDSPSPAPSETEVESNGDGDDSGSSGASSDPRFTVFDAPSKVGSCSKGGPGADPFHPMITVTWNSASAVSAWYVNGTSDAADSAYMEIPLAGDQTDFEYDQEFPCSQEAPSFTITLVGKDGSHVSKTWTMQNTGDVF